MSKMMNAIFVVAVSVTVASAALLPSNNLLAPSFNGRQSQLQSGLNPFARAPQQNVFIQPQPQPIQRLQLASSQEAGARILRQDQAVNPDGSYAWTYETENGIAAQEEGQLRASSQNEAAIAARGGFQYTSPEGQPISLQYVADENGFQPQGAHLPTSPPIPPQIARLVQYLTSLAASGQRFQ